MYQNQELKYRGQKFSRLAFLINAGSLSQNLSTRYFLRNKTVAKSGLIRGLKGAIKYKIMVIKWSFYGHKMGYLYNIK